MWKRGFTVLMATLGLFSGSLAVYPVTHLPTSACDTEAFLATPEKLIPIHPVKLVVEPWKGEHNVYGIFLVPDRFRDKPPILLNVKPLGSYCGTGYTPNKSIDGIVAPKGFFMLKQLVHTRSVLWAVAHGHWSSLNQPQNWTLIYKDR